MRIIPARAGFTIEIGGVTGGPADHPRSRGVYIAQARAQIGIGGSSPLARGLLSRVVISMSGGRIIPARAGFTYFLHHWEVISWDHPRSRGVYSTVATRQSKIMGSSPLARGLLLSFLFR